MGTQQSVVVPRDSGSARDDFAKLTDYDRENLKQFGFIYADGTYSDDREQRAATVVSRRPSDSHVWDPNTRSWYEGSEVQNPREEHVPLTTEERARLGSSSNQLSGQVVATAPSVPVLSNEAGFPGREAWLRSELAAIEASRGMTNIPRALGEENIRRGEPIPPKTDVYPTHSVAHSVQGVVTSGDPAASFLRPESLDYGKSPMPDQPRIDQIQDQMGRDVEAARQRIAANTPLAGDREMVEDAATEAERRGGQATVTSGGTLTPATEGLVPTAETGPGVVPQQGASNVSRALTTPQAPNEAIVANNESVAGVQESLSGNAEGSSLKL